MRMRMLTRLALATIAACFSGAGQAQESRYTDLVGPDCRFERDATRIGDVKRCPGRGGAEPETVAEETRTHFGLRFGRDRPAALISAWSFGTKVEWRGLASAGGFQPHAAIVRVLLKDPDSPKPDADGQVLAVIRVAARERKACVVAVVDASRRDANAVAREAADRLGRTFRCGSDRAAVVGPETRWTAAVLPASP